MTYPLKIKSEAREVFNKYVSMCSSHFGNKISTVRYNNGGKYYSVVFQKYYDDKGIRIQYTILYTSPNNSNAKRMNRTLTEKSFIAVR